MKNEPEFKAWIRTSDADAPISAQFHGFGIVGVLITIEYRPNLISLFKRILRAASSPTTKSELVGSLRCPLCNGVRDSDPRMGFYLDERTPVRTL